jgi:hypothetical protein
MGVMQQFLAHGTEQEAGEATMPAGADNHETRLGRHRREDRCRLTTLQRRLNRHVRVLLTPRVDRLEK